MGAQESQQDKTYKYHRRSTRLPKHDYSWSRGYFVTIRTSTHDPLFEVPQLHAILRETREALPQRFPGVTLDAFVIMPDHVHFILWLNGMVGHATVVIVRAGVGRKRGGDPCGRPRRGTLYSCAFYQQFYRAGTLRSPSWHTLLIPQAHPANTPPHPLPTAQ